MFYFLGDSHSLRPNRNGINWQHNGKGFLEFLISLELSSRDVVFQLGDLSDKTLQRGSINKDGGLAIKYLSETCDTVLLLQGNHDTSKYSGSYLDTFDIYDNVIVSKTVEVVEINDNLILCLPYIEGLKGDLYVQKVNDYMDEKGYDKVNFIIGHHFFNENDFRGDDHIDHTQFNFSYDYFLQGHDHKYKELSDGRFVVGSLCAWNKDDKDNEFSYMVINESGSESLIRERVPDGFFAKIKEISLSANEVEPFTQKHPSSDAFDGETFLILNIECSSAEKVHFDNLIRETYTRNIYEINWRLTDIEEFSLNSEMVSDNEIVDQYFKVSEESSEVKALFYEYLTKVVN